MNKQLIVSLTSTFEEHAQNLDGVEFWYARDLQKLLEYEQWRNFVKVIEKAQESCKNVDSSVSEHFAEVSKMVKLGSGSEREIQDFILTRLLSVLTKSLKSIGKLTN
jgi:DNA-damage-inducible protein D